MLSIVLDYYYWYYRRPRKTSQNPNPPLSQPPDCKEARSYSQRSHASLSHEVFLPLRWLESVKICRRSPYSQRCRLKTTVDIPLRSLSMQHLILNHDVKTVRAWILQGMVACGNFWDFSGFLLKAPAQMISYKSNLQKPSAILH